MKSISPDGRFGEAGSAITFIVVEGRAEYLKEPMQLEQIEELAVLLRDHPISEIEITRQESRIHLKKGAAVSMAAAPSAVSGPATVEAVHESATSTASDAVDNSVIVASEIVGHFHHVNPPIRGGSTVKEGQTIGNVESMKLINEIKSEVGGQVAEVLIEEGEPVDYGRQLFRIVPK